MVTDIFTGGPSGSPLDWSEDAPWSLGAAPPYLEAGGPTNIELSGASIDNLNFDASWDDTPIQYLILDAGASLTVPPVNLSADTLSFYGYGLDLGVGSTLNIGVPAGGPANEYATLEFGEIDGAGSVINIGAQGFLEANGPASGTVNVEGGTYDWQAGNSVSTQAVNVNGGVLNIHGYQVGESISNLMTGEIGLTGSGAIYLSDNGDYPYLPNAAATTVDTANNSISFAFTGTGDEAGQSSTYTMYFNPATTPVSNVIFGINANDTQYQLVIGCVTPSATDVFAGGDSSTVYWSNVAAWSNLALPTSAESVQMTGQGTMDCQNTSSAYGAVQGSFEQLTGLALASGAVLTLASFLEVQTDSSTFGGVGSTIDLEADMTIWAGVTSATGTVNLPSTYGTSPVYTLDGSNSSQTVNIANGTFNLGYYGGGANFTGSVDLDAVYADNFTTTAATFNDYVAFSGVVDLQVSSTYASNVLNIMDGHSQSAPSSWSINTSANTLTVTFADGDTNTLQFGSGSPVNELSVSESATAFEITLVCFVTGARIRTVRGEVPVEQLTVGDLAVTASGEARPIVWIGQRTVRGPVPAQWPVRVQAGAFGPGAPNRDLMLSPGHAVCVNAVGEVFIPIDHLINGATIAQVEVPLVTYWHVELESHDVLVANGLGCESYMDVGNRAFFGREHGRLAEIDAQRVTESLTRYARPFVDSGPVIPFVQARLAEIARTLGWAEGGDPDLHLLVDGRRIKAWIEGGSARFMIPTSAKRVELCSRLFVPAQVGAGGDRRSLGLAVLGLRIGDTAISLDDPRLADAFHPEERIDGAGWRWTNGRLVLPPELWADRPGNVELAIDFIADAFRGWRAPASRRAA